MQICIMHHMANAACIRWFCLRQAPEYAMIRDTHAMGYASCGDQLYLNAFIFEGGEGVVQHQPKYGKIDTHHERSAGRIT